MSITFGGKTTLIYGPSGSGKTSNVGFFARYLYELTARKYGKGRVTRLITCDGGGWQPAKAMEDAGILEVFQLNTVEYANAAIDQLSRGHWPAADPKNPGALLPPSKWPKLAFGQSPEANTAGHALEGLTSMADLLMKKLAEKGPNLGQGASYAYVEEGFKTFGTSQTYYGFVQTRMHKIITDFNVLPVERILWTALEAEGEDGSERIVGPALIGKAVNSKIPQWVGECIHFDQVAVEEKEIPGAKTSRIKEQVLEFRGYFRPHPNLTNGRIHRCKPRVPPEKIEELNKKYPHGYFVLEPTKGLDEFLRFEEQLMDESSQTLSDWRKEIDAKYAKK